MSWKIYVWNIDLLLTFFSLWILLVFSVLLTCALVFGLLGLDHVKPAVNRQPGYRRKTRRAFLAWSNLVF